MNWIVSPYDEFAIEEALKIKEAQGRGGRAGLGRPRPRAVRAAQRPRHGRRLGAAPQGPARSTGCDTLGTARVLAAAIKALARSTWS